MCACGIVGLGGRKASAIEFVDVRERTARISGVGEMGALVRGGGVGVSLATLSLRLAHMLTHTHARVHTHTHRTLSSTPPPLQHPRGGVVCFIHALLNWIDPEHREEGEKMLVLAVTEVRDG